MIIQQVMIEVRDIATSREFYKRALGALGLKVVRDDDNVVAFGSEARPFFFIRRGHPVGSLTISLVAASRIQVERFSVTNSSKESLVGGAGEVRKMPGYFAATIADPDGNRIEAVYSLFFKSVAVHV